MVPEHGEVAAPGRSGAPTFWATSPRPQPVQRPSPKCAIFNVEPADLQRFALKFAIGVTLVVGGAALAIDAVPLVAS